MKVKNLNIPDVKLITLNVYEDDRGFFYESFNQKKFNESIDKNIHFVQDNHSKSNYGVLRGLHYQEEPFAQGKLIRVISGEIFDVAVDIRKNSKTYGLWVAEYLSSTNKKHLWMPPGFAHGFLSLSQNTEVLYKASNFYNKDSERVIAFDDKDLDIKWPKIDTNYVLSEKDKKGLAFRDL